jgi:hypothetical protein
MIRDGLLDSEAVLSLPVEARWLYVTILLSGDDVGLFEATPFRLARIADVRREHADRLLAMLVDADLVRLYEVAGKRYGFIPKFRQRLQIKRAKCPLPQLALLAGDEDAINKIKDLGSNPPLDICAPRGKTAIQPPEPEPEPEEEEEKKKERREEKTPRKRAAPAAPLPCPPEVDPQVWADWLALRKAKKAPVTATVLKSAQAEAVKAGMGMEAFLTVWCRRGSQGLEAAWLKPEERIGGRGAVTADRSAALARILGSDFKG